MFHFFLLARETQTLCQRKRIQSMIVTIFYKGQWFPKCDAQGLFMPEQCDNTGTCNTSFIRDFESYTFKALALQIIRNRKAYELNYNLSMKRGLW